MNGLYKGIAKNIGKLLFTNRCEFCGDVTQIDFELCDACRRLPENKPPYCEYCGVSREFCVCKKKKNEYKQIIAPYLYKDSVVKAVHNFKAASMPFLSKRFAADMLTCIQECYCDIHFDAVAYVPVTKKTFYKREYNQAQLLAELIADKLGVELCEILVKIEETKPQKSCEGKERQANVYGVFDITDKDYPTGKSFLLVDDIKTTGATMNECAKMLNIYGASAVYAVSLAVVGSGKEI